MILCVRLLFVLMLGSFWGYSQCASDAAALLAPKGSLDSALFYDLAHKDTSLLGLMIVAGSVDDSAKFTDYNAQLEALFTSLDSAKLVKKSPKKIVSTIFEKVHDRLLKKYELENQFCEIFQTGYYNCVSATTVYAYMLSRLGIDHAVVEVPSHVYVIAVFESEEWVMESTNPTQGFYKLSEKDREQQIDELVEQKMLTPEQRYSSDLDSILKAMYPSEVISPARLVSIQYQNQCIYDLEEERWFSAFQNSLRGYLISSDDQNKALLINSLGSWIDLEEYDNPLWFDAVCYYISLDTSQEFITAIVEAYPYYGQQFITDEISSDQFQNITQAFRQGLAERDTALEKVELLNNLIRAQKLADQRNGLEAFPYVSRAIKLNAQDPDAQRLMLASIGFITYYESWPKAEILDTIAFYQSQYPNLRDLMWNTLYGEILLQSMDRDLKQKNTQKARLTRWEFEAMMDNPDLEKQISPALIAVVYARMALQDYNNSKARARITLQKGLEYAPGNPDLLRYAQMMGL